MNFTWHQLFDFFERLLMTFVSLPYFPLGENGIYNLRIKNGGKLYANKFVYRGLSTKLKNNIYKKAAVLK